MESMGTPVTPAPAPGATARQPLPPPVESARREGERIGRIYGEFQATLEQEFYLFFSDMSGKLAGATIWDRMGPDDRRKLLATNTQKVQALPKLPPTSNLVEATAQREGFRSEAGRAYESKRFEYWSVRVACDLATDLVVALATGGAGPVVRGIGATSYEKFKDCAAHTASRAVLEATGIEVSPGYLFRTFGLPRETLSSIRAAIAYAKNYFTKLGIILRPEPIALEAGLPLTRYPLGRYVIFMEGAGGHVVYGEITKDGITIIDDQIGKRWSSIFAAEYDLKMQIRVGYLIDQVNPPL
jgi:hypothetical protein